VLLHHCNLILNIFNCPDVPQATCMSLFKVCIKCFPLSGSRISPRRYYLDSCLYLKINISVVR